MFFINIIINIYMEKYTSLLNVQLQTFFTSVHTPPLCAPRSWCFLSLFQSSSLLFPLVRADLRVWPWHDTVRGRTEPRCPGLFCSVCVWWPEICDVRRSALFFFCFTFFWVWQPATKSSLLATSSPSLQRMVSDLQFQYRSSSLSAFKCKAGHVSVSIFVSIWTKKKSVSLIHNCTIVLSCRSVSGRVRPVHCPPNKNHCWWRLHLPLCVSPLQGWAIQAGPATFWFRGTGLLQGHLQGSAFNVQSDDKLSPGFKRLHPREEERQFQQHQASSVWWEFLPPPWHSGSLWCARNRCY